MAIPAHIAKANEELDKRMKGEAPAQEEQQPAAAPVADTTEPEIDYKARYEALKGKYDAEVPRLHAAVRELENRPAPQPAVSESESNAEFFKNQLLLDDDATKTMQEEIRRLARAEAEQMMSQVKGEVRQTAEQAFWGAVDPAYDDLKHDPGFTAWLNEPVPLTGATRMQFLQQAHAQQNPQLFNQFVTDYRASKVPKKLGDHPSAQARVAPQPGVSTGTVSTPATVPFDEFIAKQQEAMKLMGKGGPYQARARKMMEELNQLERDGRVGAPGAEHGQPAYVAGQAPPLE